MRGRKPDARRLSVVPKGDEPKGKRKSKKLVTRKLPESPVQLNERASKVYRDLGQILFARGHLIDTDLYLFALWCLSYSRLLEAEEKISAEGPTTKSARGSKLSGWVAVSRDLRKFVASLGSEFTLTTLARARANISNQTGGGDDLDAWQATS